MLSLLVFMPLFFAVVIVLISRDDALISRYIALTGSLLTAALTVYLVVRFDFHAPGLQFEDQNTNWLSYLGASYHVGLDGLSLLLVILTVVVVPVAILMSHQTLTERVPLYMSLLLLLETSLLGLFVSRDLLLFYIFWEAVLIPAYLLIGIWGGQRRVYAALKYVIYTMLGSLLMLVGVVGVYVYSSAHSFDIAALAAHPVSASLQMPLLIAFGLAFAIKSALWPFHSWVPDVYTEAATPTTIVLAGVVSKMGAYGFLRIGLPFFPSAMHSVQSVASALAVVGILYGAMLALTQYDAKRLVACSSISHMCFILLGVFALNMQGVQGATLQMVNHGVTTAALFAIVAAIAWRWGTTDLRQLGGLGSKALVLAAIFMVVTLSALGLPGLNSFPAEFLILLGAYRSAGVYGILGTLGVILAAWYMLRLYQDTMHGPTIEGGDTPAHGVALRTNELVALLPLVALIVWIGIVPGGWLQPAAAAAQAIVSAVGGAN